MAPKVETKKWYMSKGVMGSAGAVIAGILGIWYSNIESDQITDLLIAGGTLVSGFIALIGRLSADKKIE